MIRVDISDANLEVFNLDVASGEQFENEVFLENVVIGCSDNQLFMYDRSIVMGPIPFWKIVLIDETKTFVITSDTICAEDVEESCSRFPIVLNGDNRRVFKIRRNHQIAIYDGKAETWAVYLPASESAFDLGDLEVRVCGVSETYGRSGHRVGAVESPLNIFTDGSGSCIAKVFRNGWHSFYFVRINDENKEYCVLPASCCKLPEFIQQRFYGACSRTQFVFICSRGIAFVPLQPSTLRELSFLAIQKQHCTIKSGIWSGGISEQAIKDFCACKNVNSIV